MINILVNPHVKFLNLISIIIYIYLRRVIGNLLDLNKNCIFLVISKQKDLS